MLLGARQFFERRGGGGWQNPYVTDGLIAMWDGEWNAGPGVHDPTAATWKDLVGSCDADLQDGTWGENCLTLSTDANNAVVGAEVPSANFEAASWYTGNGPFTFEVCCDITNLKPSWVQHYLINSPLFLFSIASTRFLYFNMQGYQKSAGYSYNVGCSLSIQPYKLLATSCYRHAAEWSQMSIYRDYTTINGSPWSGSFGGSGGTFSQGCKIGDFPASSAGTAKINRIAIYSGLDNYRSSANYAIDKARFNLP